jgi:hypothetical protein
VLDLIKEGLETGEQCVFVAPASSLDDWLLEFQAYGIDVHEVLERHALRIDSSWLGSRSRSVALAKKLWRDIEDGLAEFKAVRYVVDVEVSLIAGATTGNLCHWEATINPLIANEPVRVVCLYSLTTDPGVLYSALRTHPDVVLEGRVLTNPHYEAPRILANEPHLNQSDADAGFVADLLAGLERLN